MRDLVLAAFRPRTSPPALATVLRSILWPLAILFIIHRSFVLATNGYITDDYGPVYRAVVNFKMGWDIYNEHFNYVDPHYLYPPGGTLMMAPFGYLPVDASRYWFITFNTIAIVLAAYFLVRLFGYRFNSVALPALLAAMFISESVINTLVFGNINGCILLLEVLFFRWLLDGKRLPRVVGGQCHRSDARRQATVGAVVVDSAAEPPVASADTGIRSADRVQSGGGISPGEFRVQGSDELRHRDRCEYIVTTRDYFNSSIAGNGLYYGLPAG